MEKFTLEYVEMWKRWNDFDGKSSVREYWMAILVNFIVVVLLSLVSFVMGAQILSSLYSLAILIPSIALFIRRMHDTNRSGWYWLWLFLPFIGWVIVILALIADSK